MVDKNEVRNSGHKPEVRRPSVWGHLDHPAHSWHVTATYRLELQRWEWAVLFLPLHRGTPQAPVTSTSWTPSKSLCLLSNSNSSNMIAVKIILKTSTPKHTQKIQSASIWAFPLFSGIWGMSFINHEIRADSLFKTAYLYGSLDTNESPKAGLGISSPSYKLFQKVRAGFDTNMMRNGELSVPFWGTGQTPY